MRYRYGKRNYRNRRRFINNFNRHKYKSKNINFISLLIGVALLLTGTLMVFQNTIIYSGLGYINFLGSGTSFIVSALPLIIGIIIVILNNRSPLGGILIVIGIGILFINIVTSLRMRFLPITLLQGLFMVIVISSGTGFIIKALIKK